MAKDFISDKMQEAAEELKPKFAKGGLIISQTKVNAGRVDNVGQADERNFCSVCIVRRNFVCGGKNRERGCGLGT